MQGRPDLKTLIGERRGGILTYGITPPKADCTPERRAEIASRQAERIGRLPVDGLVVYDLQDESARTDVPRPFPFSKTIPPAEYAFQDLAALQLPKVVYQCIAPLSASTLTERSRVLEAHRGLTVLVGAASREQAVTLRLPDAYEVCRDQAPELPVGGVLIAERHATSRAEDARALSKMELGCSFFISQAVYSVGASKDLLSDLWYLCQQQERPMPPVLVTLSPCGSLRTLDFMRWLGVSVPRWLENDLRHSKDILSASLDVCTDVLSDLNAFAVARGIPLGCNVESVSLAKAEIEASAELVHRVASILTAV